MQVVTGSPEDRLAHDILVIDEQAGITQAKIDRLREQIAECEKQAECIAISLDWMMDYYRQMVRDAPEGREALLLALEGAV